MDVCGIDLSLLFCELSLHVEREREGLLSRSVSVCLRERGLCTCACMGDIKAWEWG